MRWSLSGVPEGMAKIEKVEKIAGITRSTIYDYIKRGVFPSPVRITPSRVAWHIADVEAWVAERQREWETRRK